MEASPYPKRLIEVDLPIRRISAHARREKSIRHGHISTLHIWWARRPLAACRAVICAALWPDPADELCPQSFREAAARQLSWFAGKAARERDLAESCAPKTFKIWQRIARGAARLNPAGFSNRMNLRHLLLHFIADFANWDNSTRPEYLQTSRALTQAAHEALGGEPGTRPLVVDPFAGGGSIPLEALRVGADAFASDLNPVAVLLNKVLLEYIPRYGQRLADEVRKRGAWIKEHAEKELAPYYPKDPDGATPIAYLWARTIRCEGPGCGAEVPLIRSLWLSRTPARSLALRLLPELKRKRVDLKILKNPRPRDVGEPTARQGAGTCPVCGFTTRPPSVREQLKARRGGAGDARLLAVVTLSPRGGARAYRLGEERDLAAARAAAVELARRERQYEGSLSLVPEEAISLNEIRRISLPIYGMITWGQPYAPRQALALTTLVRLVPQCGQEMQSRLGSGLAEAVQTCLGLAVDRQADYSSSLVVWANTGEFVAHTFGRQALPIVWDFAEVNPWATASGNWAGAVDWVAQVCEANVDSADHEAQAFRATATASPMPDDSADAYITDPPYYDAVPYAYLSDYFYVWLRRSLNGLHGELLGRTEVPKDEEIVVDRPHALSSSTKDVAVYERDLATAFADGRRLLRPGGLATIVFASKATASWEAFLNAVIGAGWRITGSWPVATERESRVAAQGQARLASSVHLVCRPREDAAGQLTTDVGDWRDVIQELPGRIRAWMPRLANEGVVGADAIFACLGPALEIFSRYARVEKASGERVKLREYLEHVWAAVANEALRLVFEGPDVAGFEADARLTAMWLWTVSSARGREDLESRATASMNPGLDGDEGEADASSARSAPRKGTFLESAAAFRIAQALGATLEAMPHVAEVRGEVARLLPVAERARYLLGPDGRQPASAGRAKRTVQARLFDVSESQTAEAISHGRLRSDATTLDRLHHAMLFFAAGRAEALRRFLVEEGAGSDDRFWRLAQALAALYPPRSDERRWVEGVLARKAGLGL